MNKLTSFRINPEVAWLQEANGQVVLIKQGQPGVIRIDGFEAVLWRTLWLRFSPEIWAKLACDQDVVLAQVIEDWDKAGYLYGEGS